MRWKKKRKKIVFAPSPSPSFPRKEEVIVGFRGHTYTCVFATHTCEEREEEEEEEELVKVLHTPVIDIQHLHIYYVVHTFRSSPCMLFWNFY